MSATAVVTVPSPGMRRPSSRSYSGVVRSSTMLKIQMMAATLIKSGTATKKPATKLRRSQPITYDRALGAPQPDRDDGGKREAVPREPRERMTAQIADEVLHRR